MIITKIKINQFKSTWRSYCQIAYVIFINMTFKYQNKIGIKFIGIYFQLIFYDVNFYKYLVGDGVLLVINIT